MKKQKRHEKLYKYICKQLGSDEDVTMLNELLELEFDLALDEGK